MSAISTTGLSKRYGETLALDSLDLTVAEGEVYGFLGPNGAGKATTIRLLLGLHRPSAGRAELFGPRACTAIAYGVVTLAFLWQLVGSVVTAPHWLLDATPFAHVALIPVQPFRPGAAAIMVAIGAAAAIAGSLAFRRRDLLGA